MKSSEHDLGELQKYLVWIGKCLIDVGFLLLVFAAIIQIILAVLSVLLAASSLAFAEWPSFHAWVVAGMVLSPNAHEAKDMLAKVAPQMVTGAGAIIAVVTFLLTRSVARTTESGKALQWCNDSYFKKTTAPIIDAKGPPPNKVPPIVPAPATPAPPASTTPHPGDADRAVLDLASFYHMQMHLYLRGLIPTDVFVPWSNELVLDSWQRKPTHPQDFLEKFTKFGDRHFDRYYEKVLKPAYEEVRVLELRKVIDKQMGAAVKVEITGFWKKFCNPKHWFISAGKTNKPDEKELDVACRQLHKKLAGQILNDKIVRAAIAAVKKSHCLEFEEQSMINAILAIDGSTQKIDFIVEMKMLLYTSASLEKIKHSCREIRTYWQDQRYNPRLFGRLIPIAGLSMDLMAGCLVGHIVRKIDFDDHYRRVPRAYALWAY